MASLQALKDGKDVDGNTWYRKEWESVPTWGGLGDPRAATIVEIVEKARENAFAVAKSTSPDVAKEPWLSADYITCAYEGYEKTEAARKPNVVAVPISNHVIGKAIDLKEIAWEKFGGEWSPEANAFVAGFGLTRPYVPGGTTYCVEEKWHFELGPDPPKTESKPATPPPKK